MRVGGEAVMGARGGGAVFLSSAMTAQAWSCSPGAACLSPAWWQLGGPQAAIPSQEPQQVAGLASSTLTELELV